MKLKFLIFIFIIIVVVLTLLSIFTRREGVPLESPFPISSPSIKVQGIDESYDRSARELIPKIIESGKRSNLIGRLLEKLPYEGINFSMSYNYDEGLFIAIIKSSNKDIGLSELDSFLLDNGIEERSWITNLVIR